MSAEELKPCPFCGGRAYHSCVDAEDYLEVEEDDYGYHTIVCSSCRSSSRAIEGDSDNVLPTLMREWNERIPTAQAQPAQEGMVLVPREPTQEILDAMLPWDHEDERGRRKLYAAVIAFGQAGKP